MSVRARSERTPPAAPDRATGIRRLASPPLVIAAAIAAVIAYGSLFPFGFVPRRYSGSFIEILRASLGERQYPQEVAANLLLYAPLGLFLAAGLRRRIGGGRAFAAATLAGIALSTGMEYAQVFDRFRIPSLYDILANGTGALVGAALGATPLAAAALLRGGGGDGLAALLALAWLAFRLVPLVPALDAAEIGAHLAALATWPDEPPHAVLRDVLRFGVAWAVFAHLAAAAVGARRRWPLLAVCVAAVALVRPFLAETELGPQELIGSAAAVILVAVLERQSARAALAVVGGLLAVVVVTDGLWPFAFVHTGARFHWIPFIGILRSHIGFGILILLSKFFLYGALVWTALRLGVPLLAAAALVAVPLFAVELAQLYLPRRVPEVTDPLIALIAAGLAAALPRGRGAPVSAAGRSGPGASLRSPKLR